MQCSIENFFRPKVAPPFQRPQVEAVAASSATTSAKESEQTTEKEAACALLALFGGSNGDPMLVEDTDSSGSETVEPQTQSETQNSSAETDNGLRELGDSLHAEVRQFVRQEEKKQVKRRVFTHEEKDLVLKSNESVLSAFCAPLRRCLLYTSPSPRDLSTSRMPSSA